MLKRVTTGVVAAGAVVAAVLLLDSSGVFVICILALEAATFEYVRLGRNGGADGRLRALLFVVPALSALWVVESPLDPWIVLGAAPAAFGLVVLAGRSEPASSVATLGWLTFGVGYLVLPTWSLYEIHANDRRLLLVLLLAVWLNDTAALLVGSKFGRSKMAPRLSPNKTWEGSIAGLVTGVAVGIGGVALLGGPMEVTAWHGAIFLLVSAAAQAGDLVESLLKRAVGVKDSGNLLPGHGGMLDRLDAMLVASPVFWVLSTFLL